MKTKLKKLHSQLVKCIFILIVITGFSSLRAETPLITLSDCVIQAAIPGAKVTAAYLNIHYAEPDQAQAAPKLVAARVDALTPQVEIHEMAMSDGVMSMQKITAFQLKAGDNVFKKGGYHIMLMALEKMPKPEEAYPLVLVFDNGSEYRCDAEVKAREGMHKNQ